jgi:hypothetical protein
MVVGGRELDLNANEVLDKMRNVEPEPIRDHLVESQDGTGRASPPWKLIGFSTASASTAAALDTSPTAPGGRSSPPSTDAWPP